MVKKIIGIADIHIVNLPNKIKDLKEVCETFFGQARKVVEDSGGPEFVRIAVLGDLFDAKLEISNEGLLAGH